MHDGGNLHPLILRPAEHLHNAASSLGVGNGIGHGLDYCHHAGQQTCRRRSEQAHKGRAALAIAGQVAIAPRGAVYAHPAVVASGKDLQHAHLNMRLGSLGPVSVAVVALRCLDPNRNLDLVAIHGAFACIRRNVE